MNRNLYQTKAIADSSNAMGTINYSENGTNVRSGLNRRKNFNKIIINNLKVAPDTYQGLKNGNF